MDMTQLQPPAAGATADAAILAARERHRAAYATMASLDPIQRFDAGSASTEELRLLRQINEAEEILAASVATTPSGIQAQFWAGLFRTLECAEADKGRALLFGDLEYLEGLGNELDWNIRLMIAGLRSLRAIDGEV